MGAKVSRKGIMFAIISSLESDFINWFAAKLQLADIPKELLTKANRVTTETSELLSYLRGLDIQAYIEISNANISKLQITKEQKDFLNIELCKLPQIRNRVMHPRLEELTDLPVLQTIATELCNTFGQYDWKELRNTLNQVDKDPSVFQLPQSFLAKNEKIIQNLPEAIDYDETTFIGRRREIGEVRAKLNKRNVHVLSIIGDGGVGKTALTLKMLYDMLDDPNCSFELILWASLKTNALTGYEFKKIEDAITTTAEMYDKLGEFVGTHEHEDVPSYLIDLAQNFNTLLVLDNLETINSSEVKQFIDSFSEYGKVLITSRIGLGEMEYRYRLDGLNPDDVLEYMNVLLDLYGMPGLLTNDQKVVIARDELHSNPLAIKWFVKSLHNHPDVEAVLAHKKDLIVFCMSNVYEKLSPEARGVLELLQIAHLDLSRGELVYYTDSSIDDMVIHSNAINELIKCNFLDDTKYNLNGLLSITDFASEFLDSQVTVSRDKELSIIDKQKRLNQFVQQLEQKKATSPTSNDTFHCYGTNRDRIVAAFYLGEAVEAINTSKPPEVALEYANIARIIALDYSEVYVVLGLCYARNSPDKAKLEYEKALGYSQSDYEAAIIHTRYARFLRLIHSFPEAIDHLEKALSHNQNDYTALFELIMTLGWVNKFERAEQLLNDIDINQLSERQKIDYYMRRADILRRKADACTQEQTKEAFCLLKEAYDVLYEDNVQDKRKASVLVTILVSLSHLSLNTEIEEFIIKLLDAHYRELRNEGKYKNFQRMMSDKLPFISESNREKLLSYSLDINEILLHIGNKEGVMIRVNEGYGFMRVPTVPSHIYIKLTPSMESLEIGDVVTYEKIIKGGKGFMASGVKLQRKVKDILNELHD